MASTHNPTLNKRARDNIRLLKAVRRVSDQQIADAAGYTSRQMIADRIGGSGDRGRTAITIDDLEAIAEVLSVEPLALLGTAEDLMRWISENPNYRPPKRPRRRRPTGEQKS